MLKTHAGSAFTAPTSSNETAIDLLLDMTAETLLAGEVGKSMANLVGTLHILRSTLPRHTWQQDIIAACHAHPVWKILLEDPFTARSVEKPRGYAGDAVMLDFIYSGLPDERRAETTACGQSIFGYTAGLSGSARAVRARRTLLARELEAVTARRAGAHILSVACGHLREAGDVESIRAGRFGRFLALDQDRASLDVVESELGGLGIEALHADIRSLINGEIELSELDFIYSAGLYDYLPEAAATLLTERLFASTSPGGRLIVANFVPDYPTAGYMEAFMDWRLRTRNATEMTALLRNVAATEIEDVETFLGDEGYVVYLAVTRRE